MDRSGSVGGTRALPRQPIVKSTRLLVTGFTERQRASDRNIRAGCLRALLLEWPKTACRSDVSIFTDDFGYTRKARGRSRLIPGRIEAGKVAIGLGISRPANAVAIFDHGRTATRLPGGRAASLGLFLLRRQRRRGANDALAVDDEAGGLARAERKPWRRRLPWASAVAAARAAAAASAERPWSIEKGIFGAAVRAGAGAGACAGVCADTAETPAAAKSTITAIIRIFNEPAKRARTFRSLLAASLEAG